MRPKKMLKALYKLGYVEVRRKGSHRWLSADGRPDLLFAFHDGDDISPGLVRDILVKQVGLTLNEAREALR